MCSIEERTPTPRKILNRNQSRNWVNRYRNIPNYILRNNNGGYYQPGHAFNLIKKTQVINTYMKLHKDALIMDRYVRVSELAYAAKVSWNYARKIIYEVTTKYSDLDEFLEYTNDLDDDEGISDITDEMLYSLDDPNRLILTKKYSKGIGTKINLSVEECLFLLSLRTEKDSLPNYVFVQELEKNYGRKVSSSFITNFFLRGFDHKGSYRLLNKVPFDKFTEKIS